MTSVTPFGVDGAAITVDGTNFSTATHVNFVSRATSVSTPGLSLQIVGNSELTITVPSLALGSYDVRVVNPDGTSPLDPTTDTFTAVNPAVVAATHFTSTPLLSSLTTLDVTSTADFTHTGSLFVQTTNGVATISYTGVTATSFTGCTVVSGDPFHVGASDTTGTLDLAHPAVYQATNTKFNYTLQNQTNLPDAAQNTITYAMFWSSAANPGVSYYLNSSNPDGSDGEFSPVTDLGAGGVLPTYTTIASGGTVAISLPYMPINAARFVFGVGTAPHLVVTSGNAVSTPDPTTTNSIYDFIEATVDASGADNSVPLSLRFLPTVNINTSQVDQFGFPITLTGMNNNNGTPVTTSVGVTLSTNVARDAIFSEYSSLHPSGSDPYGSLVIASGDPTQPYRILNPGKATITTSDALGYVFDSTIQQLFEGALPDLTLTSGVNGQTYTSTRTTVSGYKVLQFSGPDISPVNVYEPFFSTNAPSPSSLSPVSYAGRPAKPSWLTAASETPGQMVFGNDGVFADAGLQPGLSSLQQQILADLENQIVAALNRGVATAYTTTADWQNPNYFYADGQVSNLYAKFLHKQAISGTPIFIDGKAYAIAYDDQAGQNPSLVLLNQSGVTTTFGPWQAAADQNSNFVKAVYQSVLDRAADTAGLNYWLGLLTAGTSRYDVSLGIVGSVEGRTDYIQGLYMDLLNRTGDAVAVDYFLGLYTAGATDAQVKSIIFGSSEYFELHGGSNSGFLDGLYLDELSRSPDSDGFAYFSQLLSQGTSRTDVAAMVIGSLEGEQDTVESYYEAYLARPADPGGLSYWTGQLQQDNNDELVQAGILGSEEYYLRA